MQSCLKKKIASPNTTLDQFDNSPPTEISLNEQQAMIDKQLEFTARTFSSFSIHESDGMVNLIQHVLNLAFKYRSHTKPLSAASILGSRKKVKNAASDLVDKIEKSNYQEFIQAGPPLSISVTCDLWADKYNKNSVIDVQCSFIDKEFKFHHVMLDMLAFPEQHTGENIKVKVLDTIIQKLHCTLESIHIFFTTDAASNMCKAFEGFNSQKCMAHRLHTVTENALNAAKLNNDDLKYFYIQISKLVTHVSHKNNIQKK